MTRVGLTKVAPRRSRKVGPAHQLKRQIPAVFDTKPLAPLRAICPSVKAAVWHDWHAQPQRIEGWYEIVAARFEGGAPALVFGQAVGLEAGQRGMLGQRAGADEKVLCQSFHHMHQGRRQHQPAQAPTGHTEVLAKAVDADDLLVNRQRALAKLGLKAQAEVNFIDQGDATTGLHYVVNTP